MRLCQYSVFSDNIIAYIILKRDMEKAIRRLEKVFSVIGVIGPRQSGKSTLVKHLFPDRPYLSLEDMDNQQFAKEDPRKFLEKYAQGAVFDEVQRCPSLFSYLQSHVDEQKKMGAFILTGSQQFNLLEKITQSLAGRIGLLTLLPFSFSELAGQSKFISRSLDNTLLTGSCPPIFDRNPIPSDWFSSYVRTYLERDVRQVINIKDLSTFQRFLRLCAGRNGQILDIKNLGSACGVTSGTVNSWLNVLEASFICFRLQPYFKNFNKRLVKRPKLYFYDSGLLCWLLGIKNEDQLSIHPMRESIFESWAISEFHKAIYAKGEVPSLYYWRDNSGTEIDLILEQGGTSIPIEIKSSATMNNRFFNNLNLWQKYSKDQKTVSCLIFGGRENQSRSKNIEVYSWKNIADLFLKLI